MQPIVYVRNAERAAKRLEWLVPATFSAVMLGGVCYVFAAGVVTLSDVAPYSWVTWGLFAVPVGSWLLTWLSAPVQGLGDRLRLDREGVTLAQRGRNRHWRWSEIADVELGSRFDPKALWRGRSLNLRPAGGGPKLVIADDYFTPVEEIAARLRSHWELANGRADETTRRAAARGGARVYEPMIIRKRRSSDRDGVRQFVVFSLAVVLGLSALSVGLFGWPLDWASLEAAASKHGSAMVGAAVTILLTIPGALRMGSPAWNFLLLADDGLHLRKDLRSRHWAWRDLSGFELRRVEPRAGTEQKSCRTISFSARHDGSRARRAAEAALAIRIDDDYAQPLEEILPQLERWRAARKDAAASTRDAAGQDVSTVPLAGQEQAISFRSSGGDSAISILVVILMCGLSFAVSSGLIFVLWADLPRELSTNFSTWVFAGVMGLWLMFLLAPMWLLFRMVKPGANQLLLETAGLVYQRAGLRRHWDWEALAAFDLTSVKPRLGGKPVDILTCTVPDDDRLSRYMRWWYGLSTDRPTIVIEDTYETPLDEIAARLDEFRERATGERPPRAGAEEAA